MAKALTMRQQEILDFIRTELREQGRAPTVQEIQGAFGFRSPNAVQTHLAALQRKRAIERVEGRSRAIAVIEAGPDSFYQPAGQEQAEVLTDRQREVLDFILSSLKDKGPTPTIQEMMTAFGFNSPNAVQTHLKALERKGVLTREGRAARGLRVSPEVEAGVAPSAPPPPPPVVSDDETAVQASFNATHQTRGEFFGELHAHAWKVEAVVALGKGIGARHVTPSELRTIVEEEVKDLNGATLNELDYFIGLEPDLEQVALWLNRLFKVKVRPTDAAVVRVTVWDQPSNQVTIRTNLPS